MRKTLWIVYVLLIIATGFAAGTLWGLLEMSDAAYEWLEKPL